MKPSREGSSLGISICKTDTELEKAIQKAFEFDSEVFIEQFIEGRELAVPLLKSRVLTPIEIIPKEGFYDYRNKYTKGKTDYILPPKISENSLTLCKSVSLQIWNLLKLRGFGRVDFMLSKKEELYCIEVNTLPGMTPLSLLPQSAKYENMDFDQLVLEILDSASLDYV